MGGLCGFGCKDPHGPCGGRLDRVSSGFSDDSSGDSDRDGFSNAPATYAGAGLLFRVMVTSSGPDPKRLVLDAPTNHPRVESMTSALDSPKTRASTVSTFSEARVVDTLTHSLIGTQARVADSRMTHTVLSSQSRLADTRITHAPTISQARVVDTRHASTISQARVVDSRMPPKLDGSQARVMDGAVTHALIGSQARVADSLETCVGPVVTVWMVGTLMSH